MRILFVIHQFLPRRFGGRETYSYHLAKELICRGHQVYVFTREYVLPINQERTYFYIDEHFRGLKVRRIVLNRDPTISTLLKNKIVDNLFEVYLNEINPEIVHFQHLLGLSTNLINFAKEKKIPTVLSLADFWFMCPSIQLLKPNNQLCPGPGSGDRCVKCLEKIIPIVPTIIRSKYKIISRYIPNMVEKMLKILLGRLYSIIFFKSKKQLSYRVKFMRNLLNEFDLVISPSNFLREKYIKFGLKKEKIIYSKNGMDIKLFESFRKKPSAKIRFGFIGTLNNIKGVHILINAFNMISDNNVELKIYGDGRKEYLRKLKEVCRNKNIKFLGKFNNEDIGKIFTEIDLLVVPSLWYENSPLVIHEAFIANTPVIASNIGGMAELITDQKNGLLFERNNPKDLYRKIKMIVDDPSYLERLSKNFERIKTIEENAQEMEEIYCGLFKKKDRSYKNISVIILNWNGLNFLKKCIPSVIKAVNYGNNCEIIVVDNGSSDGSIDYLKSNFSQIRIIPLRKNLGFAKAMNIGIKEAKADIVIGLNNDVMVEEDFILPLVSHFSKDGGLFAVAAKMLLWDRRTLNFGRAIGKFRFGIFRRRFQEPAIPTNTLYACGGAFAVDRNKFLELGGFDEDMIVYWEDLDLCYRAWKQGYRTIYEPRSIVYHKMHGSYIKKCGENGIRKISGENYFLFAIKNFHDRSLFYQQLFSLPLLILVAPLLGKSHFGLGLLRSLKRWPLFLKKRKEEKQKAIFSDREVLHMSSR